MLKAAKWVERYDKAKQGRAIWESVWQDVADYMLPVRSNIIVKRSSVKEAMADIHDSTAPHALNLLATALHSSLTGTGWFNLRISDDSFGKQISETQRKAINKWLKEDSDIEFHEFAQSNFHKETYGFYTELVAFGISVLLFEEVSTGEVVFNFKSIPIADIVLFEDSKGVFDIGIRAFKLSAERIIQEYPHAKSRRLEQALRNDPDEELELLHVIAPVGEYRSKMVNKDHAFVSLVIIKEDEEIINTDENGLLKGYYEFPLLIARWAQFPGDIYAVSPAMLALFDTKTLNKLRELDRNAREKAVNPPLEAVRGALDSSVGLTPGFITWVREKGSIRELTSTARFDVSEQSIQDLRNSIRQMFFIDQLQFPPLETQGTPMTATEAQIRFEFMQRILGPIFYRFEYEFLTPLVKRGFKILARAGKLPDPPPFMGNLSSIEVEYYSPLSRARRFNEVMAIERWLAFVGNISQVFSKARLVADEVKAVQLHGRIVGVPESVMRTEREVEELEKQERQALQAQQALEQANVAADSLQKLSKAGQAM